MIAIAHYSAGWISPGICFAGFVGLLVHAFWSDRRKPS